MSLVWSGLMTFAAPFLLILALVAADKDDQYLMSNGDRISGKTVSKSKTTMVVQTAYGRLTLPRAKIDKIVYGDGHEEVVAEGPEPAIHLVVNVSGNTFWQAWSKNSQEGLDPTLRLDIRLDDDPIATYVDDHLDPGDLPGAIVNSFSFLAGEVKVTSGKGAIARPPETKPGLSVLRIDLSSSLGGDKHLVFAYQRNEGTKDEPSWKDLAKGEVAIELHRGLMEVAVEQNRGKMEYSGLLGKHMRNVDTFRVDVHPKTGS
jgi:hypothetical protein